MEHILTAFVLGILVAINPCQLAISISALTYIIRRDMARQASFVQLLLYALGRSITYTVLGWILICLLGGGKNIDGVQNLLSKSEALLPYILVAMGLFMLYRGLHRHHHEHGEDCHNSGQLIKRNGPMGSLILGITLALAFCPESAVFYFGIMIPLSVTSDAGPLIPIIFAIGAALPVIALAVFMHKTANKMLHISHTFEHFQQGINIITALIFFALAAMVWFA